jgi:hypothetical protein
VPLFVFNTWATGRPWSLSYAHAVLVPGRSGHDVLGANATGFFGLGLPSLHSLVELLVSAKGLLVLSPVWLLATIGLVMLWRSGRRAEAAVCIAATGLFVLYDAAYYLPFGGFNGGPRFLVPMLPFLAIGVAVAWRDLPGPTLALGLASIVVTTVTILADPMLVSEDVGTMFHRLIRGGDQNGPLPLTVFHWFWDARIAPLLIVGAVVVVVVLATVPHRLTRRQALLGIGALLAWRVVYSGAPILINGGDHWWVFAGLLPVVLGWVVALALRGERLAALPALLLLPVGWPRFVGHASLAAVTISVAAVALAAVAARSRRAATPAAP